MNKDKKIGINEAERFSRAFPIFCITSLIENLEDTYIRDLVLKYKPEFVRLNVKQRDMVVRFLEQELIK